MAKFNKINQKNFNLGFYKTKKRIKKCKKKINLILYIIYLNLIKSYIKIYMFFQRNIPK